MTTLQEYYDRLERHDWSYHMSDNFNVFKRGSLEQRRLYDIASESYTHGLMFTAWSLYMSTSSSQGIIRAHKPERPE